ncbi:hypothetical protein BaRGS_00020901, partial [Batillaria attramentaria]
QGVKGATCSGDSDCIDNAVCTNGACVCDASKGYKVAAATGACSEYRLRVMPVSCVPNVAAE